MKISDAKFIISAAAIKQFPETEWPEVAFAGRSNVGKSSLINMLLGRKNLVRVSRRPGRTQQINFFAINNRFHLVDLPGYGFAKAPEKLRIQWNRLIQSYVETRPQLGALVLLLDVRREPSREDMAAVELFRHFDLPCLIAITKADKLPLQRRQKQVSSIAKALNLSPGDCHVTSATTGMGRDLLWEALECFLLPADQMSFSED